MTEEELKKYPRDVVAVWACDCAERSIVLAFNLGLDIQRLEKTTEIEKLKEALLFARNSIFNREAEAEETLETLKKTCMSIEKTFFQSFEYRRIHKFILKIPECQMARSIAGAVGTAREFSRDIHFHLSAWSTGVNSAATSWEIAAERTERRLRGATMEHADYRRMFEASAKASRLAEETEFEWQKRRLKWIDICFKHAEDVDFLLIPEEKFNCPDDVRLDFGLV